MYTQQQLDEEKKIAEYWKIEFYAASDRLHRLIDEKIEQKPTWFDMQMEKMLFPGKYYTQNGLDEAIEKAFDAGRKIKAMNTYLEKRHTGINITSLYETFQDYKKTLSSSPEQKPINYNEHAKNVYQSVAPVKDWVITEFITPDGVEYHNSKGVLSQVSDRDKIISVKRLSDGVVFTIGEEICAKFPGTPEEGKIISFTIYEGHLKVLFEHTNKTKMTETFFNKIQKLPSPKPSPSVPVKDWEVWAYEEKYGVRDYSYEYGHVIKAVKRLSDNVVFSNKDYVTAREGEYCDWAGRYKIISMSVKTGTLGIELMHIEETSPTGSIWREIQNIQKLPSPKPSPLFTLSEIIKCYEKSAPLYSPLFNSFIENLTQSKISTI